MRPLAVLLGIVMGSAVSIAAGLILTWVVFLFLSDSAARFAPERLPLARGASPLYRRQALARSHHHRAGDLVVPGLLLAIEGDPEEAQPRRSK